MVNNVKNISKIIYLLDKHILNILSNKEINEDKLDSLTTSRIEYVQELNSFISMKNTREMYNEEYWKSYRRNKIN
jgi:hypothetical protein